ncbi:MAG: hypothetical protein NTU72_00645 [Fimbriimonadales bacterium]|nr:hypothetical protein [Fimbriimonadales bacterium]
MSNQHKGNRIVVLAQQMVSAALIPALLVAMLAFGLTPKAPAANVVYIVTYDGVAGGHSGSCTVTGCNSSNGCRSTNSYIFDRWYPRTSCSGDPIQNNGGTPTCNHDMLLCRDIETYSDSNCHGTVTHVERTRKGACA